MLPLRDSIPSRTFPAVTYGIIAVNVLAFIYQAALDEKAERRLVLEMGLKPGYVTGYLAGRKGVDTTEERLVGDFFGRIYKVESEKYVRLTFWNTFFPFLSCMFLHGGLAHVLGNMWFLYIFGDNVEDRLGRLRFLGFYLATGVLASVAQVAMMPSSVMPTIGASGAVSGVLGAYLLSFPHARVLSLVPIIIVPLFFEVPAVLFLGLWFVIQFVSGIGSNPGSSGVAFWAHVGGFVAGMAAVKLIPPRHDGGSWRNARDVPFEIIDED